MGFPVCYRSPSDVLAVSSGFVHIYIYIYIYIYIFYALKKKRKERRWWQRQLHTSREVYSGSSLLEDLNFQSVSGLYSNFPRMSPSEFEFLINLIGEKFSKKDTVFRKAISIQERLAPTLRFDKFYDTFLSPQHFTITKTFKKPHNTTDTHHSSRKKPQEWKEGQRSGRWLRVTLHVHTCSGRNYIIPLIRRPNTDSTPNKSVTLPRNQLLIRYVVTSPVHTVTIRWYSTG